MGEHVDIKKNYRKKKNLFTEGTDVGANRRRRVSFKSYLRDIDEELLETDPEPEDEDDDPEVV
jgi:hypothetical protein